MEVVIILPDLRSVYNVGAIFRTAEAIGASKIFLSGTTPAPVDRFGRIRKDFAKSSLGSEKNIAWEHVDSLKKLINKIKKDGFEIIAVEQTKKSVDYKEIRPKKKTAIIFGNEVAGISKSILKIADKIAEIPMRGKKESLNVSVAAGIVLFRFFDR